MPRRLILLLLLSLVCTTASAAETSRLRQAMTRHDTAQNVQAHKRYGAALRKIDPSAYHFKYALVDLNGDGIKDAVVYLTGEWCGSGGCTMRIMKGTQSGFSYLCGTLRVFPPVQLLASKSHGWKSIVVGLRSGGSGILKFNGQRYPLSPPDHRAPNSELSGAVTLIPR